MSKDWVGNEHATFAQLGASNHCETKREINDFYATDPKTLEIFLNKLQEDGINLHKNIWECACGQGHLSKILEAKGYKVWSTDLIDRGYGEGGVDFLTCLPGGTWIGDIITNPPYKYAKQFVEKALEITQIGKYTIMLLKIQFLEGKERYHLFKKYPPKYIYVNSSRQKCVINGDFKNSGTSAMCYCWYVWEKGFYGEPKIRWIKGD